MSNYTKFSLGSFSDVAKVENGKVFLHDKLSLTSCEVSVNVMPAHTALSFSHSHKENEEIYIFLSGSGKVILDGEKIPFKEGDSFRVAPACKRSLESIEETHYICIQAKEGSLKQFGLGDANL